MKEVRLDSPRRLYNYDAGRYYVLCGLWIDRNGEDCLREIWRFGPDSIRIADDGFYISLPEFLADVWPSSYFVLYSYDLSKVGPEEVVRAMQNTLRTVNPQPELWMKPVPLNLD